MDETPTSGAVTAATAPEPAADPVMLQIGEAMALIQNGDRAGARRRYEEIWAQVGPDGDPFHRCALAHHLADLQDDPADELLWDQRALVAADAVTDDRAQSGGVASVQGFYPSLHLNLGDVYLRMGQLTPARVHLVAGQAAVGALGEDGYGRMISDGLRRLSERIEAAS